jgi:hypothetical protein
MSHGMFIATCEKCGDGVALTADQQTRLIGLRGEFRCSSCGGSRPMTRLAPPKPKKQPKPKPAKIEAPALTEEETRCCLKGGPAPTYFRPCPDCPAGL